jgi:hypothetical protein
MRRARGGQAVPSPTAPSYQLTPKERVYTHFGWVITSLLRRHYYLVITRSLPGKGRYRVLCITRTRVSYMASTTLVHRNIVNINATSFYPHSSLSKHSDQTSLTA